MTAYFTRIDERRFTATNAVQGAWNTEEQHIAPVLGLIAHVVEQDQEARGGVLDLSRISHDIYGVLPIGEVQVDVKVLRAGRTIELVEATVTSEGRAAVVSRAWFMQPSDTEEISGTSFTSLPDRSLMEQWRPSYDWPGEFIEALTIHRQEAEPGRGMFWVNPTIPLVAGEEVSPTARLLGIVDIANGMTPRADPREVLFPNLDLTAHLFRAPESAWLGFDTTVSFGVGGIGMTHSVLHDERGPLGTSVQSLTIRPRRA